MSRRGSLLVLLVVLALLAVGGALYYRHRVDQAAADCAMPAPPDKPATPPPDLPGFQTQAACGPGGAPTEPGEAAKKKN